MSGNFNGIKRRNFGIEIEMTGLTRCQAAKAAAKTLGGQVSHNGGYYDKYSVRRKSYRPQSCCFSLRTARYAVKRNRKCPLL